MSSKPLKTDIGSEYTNVMTVFVLLSRYIEHISLKAGLKLALGVKLCTEL